MVNLSSTEFEPELLLEQAQALLPTAPPNEEFKGFCKPDQEYATVQTSYESTARMPSTKKAELLESFRKKHPELWLGGIFETSVTERIIACSNGLFLPEKSTEYKFEMKAELNEKSISVFRAGRDIDKLNIEKEMAPALELLEKNVAEGKAEKGVYRCLLGPEAVSELIFFLSLLGFGGRAFKQKRSFTAEKLGENLFENSSIVLKDNGQNPDSLTRAFDDWGFPRKPLTLLDKGKVVEMAHDQFTAESTSGNTGHGDGGGPYPMLMELKEGNKSQQELLESGEDTIIISRFHYPTIADPSKPLIKGSTKDGTYLRDKDGMMTDLGSLEFYFDPVKLLAATRELSSERFVIPQGSLALSRPGANVVPWLLVTDIELRHGALYKS